MPVARAVQNLQSCLRFGEVCAWRGLKLTEPANCIPARMIFCRMAVKNLLRLNVRVRSARLLHAGVAELADAQDLGSCGLKTVEVQILSPAPTSGGGLLRFAKLRFSRLNCAEKP
jgi:hypothetical protein